MAEVESSNNTKMIESNINQMSMMAYMPGDPISLLILAPVLPVLYLMNSVQMLINQSVMAMQIQRPYENTQSRTKVTSITRTGNTLDIIEKWI